MDAVVTRVPATTSNLGSGFDCLGIALGLSNRVTVRPVDVAPEHPGIVTEAAEKFFSTAGVKPIAFTWSIEGEVPRSRGLGSSVTVRLGLLHGLNRLTGAGLDEEVMFNLCAELEGHPDNAAPAAFGGFTVSRQGMPTIRCEIAADLQFVLLIPDFEVSTPAARDLLPSAYPKADVVRSVGNACRVTAAFLQQKYELLSGCFEDGLHQPYREPLIPFLSKTIAAGVRAGALGGFLSGSGSTICCLTLKDEKEIAAAMLDASPPGSQIVITTANNEGAEILTEDVVAIEPA
jgi:homoserine kinase